MASTFKNVVELKHQFASAVRRRRGELGVTQEELAWRAGLHRTYLASIESGTRNPSLQSIAKLARALDVSLAVLFASAERTSRESTLANGGGTVRSLVEILLIEDNPDDVSLTLSAFQQARIANRVHVAEDGAAALEYLMPVRKGRKVPSSVAPPNLILLDLGLPKLSGLEVLRRIRAEPRTRKIPVIVMTVSRDTRDFAECRKLGVDHFILKPVGFQNLIEVTPHLNLNWALLMETPPLTRRQKELGVRRIPMDGTSPSPPDPGETPKPGKMKS